MAGEALHAGHAARWSCCSCPKTLRHSALVQSRMISTKATCHRCWRSQITPAIISQQDRTSSFVQLEETLCHFVNRIMIFATALLLTEFTKYKKYSISRVATRIYDRSSRIDLATGERHDECIAVINRAPTQLQRSGHQSGNRRQSR